jgi:hypothetical protein
LYNVVFGWKKTCFFVEFVGLDPIFVVGLGFDSICRGSCLVGTMLFC